MTREMTIVVTGSLRVNKEGFLFTDKGATYEFRVLARNEIDYGERSVTRIDTPDGGWYFIDPHVYFALDFLCSEHGLILMNWVCVAWFWYRLGIDS